MNRWRCALIVALLAVATSASAETTFTQVGSYTGPMTIVYYGTEFAPLTVSIDVGTTVTGTDTTHTLWFRFPGNATLARAGIERLPFDSKADRPDPPVPTAEQLQRVSSERQAVAQYRAQHARTESETPRTNAAAVTEGMNRYKANPLVEAVRVDTDNPTTVWWVKWKGHDDWERMVIMPTPQKPTAATRLTKITAEAEHILQALRDNQIVVIDNGFRRCSTTPAGRRQLEDDLAAARQGQPVATFRSSQVVNHLRNPVDLRLVVEGGMR